MKKGCSHLRTVSVRRSDGTTLLERVEVASTFFERLRGLLGRKGLAPGEALLIVPCNSVHTCFMRFPIDVVFLGRDGAVLAIARCLRPWRFYACRGAFAALELSAGSSHRLKIAAGDRLDLGLGVGCPIV